MLRANFSALPVTAVLCSAAACLVAAQAETPLFCENDFSQELLPGKPERKIAGIRK